jgi:hypothetical protein
VGLLYGILVAILPARQAEKLEIMEALRLEWHQSSLNQYGGCSPLAVSFYIMVIWNVCDV